MAPKDIRDIRAGVRRSGPVNATASYDALQDMSPRKTARELLSELNSDPGWVDLQNKVDLQHRMKLAAVVEEQDRFLRILQTAGVAIHELGEIETSSDPSLIHARPRIIELIPQIKMPDVQEGIIRMLRDAPKAHTANKHLLRLFETIDDPTGQVRWVIGNAFANIATPKDFEGIARLALDSSFGQSREMLLLALARTKDRRALPMLIDLLQDDQVSGYAVMALGKLKDPDAIDSLKPFLHHPITWIRKEARKSLKKLGVRDPGKV